MLFPRLACRVQGEEFASELDDQEIQDDDNSPDAQESWVAPEVLANVEFIVDLPGGYHVDDLQPDEQVEDESQVARILIVSVVLLNRNVEGVSADSEKSAREHFVVGLPIGVTKRASLDVETKLHIGLINHKFTSE